MWKKRKVLVVWKVEKDCFQEVLVVWKKMYIFCLVIFCIILIHVFFSFSPHSH